MKKNIFNIGARVRKYLPNPQEKTPSYVSLFKYAEAPEKTLIALGILASIVSGVCYPVIIVLFAEFTTSLIERNTPNETFHQPLLLTLFGGARTPLDGTMEDLEAAILEDSAAYGTGIFSLAAIEIVASFSCVACLNYAVLRQMALLRRQFFKAILGKDMAWYDVNGNENFATKLTEDLNNMQEGMGEKIGLFLTRVVSFIVFVAWAFASGWELTLVTIACIPILTLSTGLVSKVQASMVVKEQKAYGKASASAEEAFLNVKTVMAFGGEEKELEKYRAHLNLSLEAGIKRGLLSGFGSGMMWFIIYSAYALAFWYGVTLIIRSRENGDGLYSPAMIPIVLFGVIVASMSMGQCMPYLEAFTTARASAASVFRTLESDSFIDPFSTTGKILPDVEGDIELSGVRFHYPARQGVEVLKDFSMKIESGSKVALVGSSGSGKSTVVQLIQRLYDPNKGTVRLDGVDLTELNVGWLRQQIGVVSQEPQLFATTIYENIRFGMISASRNEIEQAAKLANAHDFITKLPKGYDTMIGQRGTQLSGGQKQRIAIARAIVRNPKILLLDEATSALDSSNEAMVQQALDSAAKGRTTLVVAHRLSTVINSDRIIVMSDGRFVESGTHAELMKLEGEYCRLRSMLETEKGDAPPEEKLPSKGYIKFYRDSLVEKIDEVNATKSKLDDLDEVEKVTKEDISKASVWRIFAYSKSEWLSIVIGCIGTIVVGCSCPVLAILFGELYGALAQEDLSLVRSEIDYYCVMLLVLGVSVGIAFLLQLYSFGRVSSHLTTRLRTMAFAAVLRQEPAWFDKEENKVGALCAKLSGSAADIQAIAGTSLSIVLQGATTLIFGFIVSFTLSWKMTLVACIGLPLVFFGIYYEFCVIAGQNLLEKESIEGATKIAVEGINGIRTVASLGREQTFLDRFDVELKVGEKVMTKKAFMRGVIFSMGQSATPISYGVSLWYGGTLVATRMIHFKDAIKISEALLFGVWLLGQSLAFAPSFAKARLSAGRIFALLDRTSGLADGMLTKGKDKQSGGVEYSKVEFSYPARPEDKVLKELSLSIPAGTSIAIAGASGCGKSTLVQLLQRFYDPSSGAVRVDDIDIRELPIAQLRNQMSIVSQEPVLFDATIGENIAYGDNTREVTQDEIVRAAKVANIHNFITSLPLGYETNLGRGGGQLSGGQKQRIAIARALIRNPRILLLDEATSALDAASEAVVQDALDEAATGRTTITVGHRPAAIARASVICVLYKGQLAEQGTHQELLSANGIYSRLNLQQKH